jgi:hypothetical protein
VRMCTSEVVQIYIRTGERRKDLHPHWRTRVLANPGAGEPG